MSGNVHAERIKYQTELLKIYVVVFLALVGGAVSILRSWTRNLDALDKTLLLLGSFWAIIFLMSSFIIGIKTYKDVNLLKNE
jgi:glucan phosphoethanolaminetransferase (alkaline phosphatase superfamily)